MAGPTDSPARPPLHLYWPVRASFLRYVAGLSDGRASVSDGAALTRDDPQEVAYVFDSEHTTQRELRFHGDLRLTGHGGLLFVRIAHPSIMLDEDGERAELTVDDPQTEDGSGPRIPLVTLRMTRHTSEAGAWSGTDVQLTPDGVELFNNVYAAGEPFDPLTVAPMRHAASS